MKSSITSRFLSILVGVVCLIFILYGCSSSEDSDDSSEPSGSSSNTAKEQEIVYVADKIFSSLDTVSDNPSTAAVSGSVLFSKGGNCFTPDPNPVTDFSSFSVSYTDCTFSDSNLVLSGTMAFSSSISGSTMSLSMTGTITGTGGLISTMIFNLTGVLPYDTVNQEITGDAISVTGSVTADDVVYNATDIDWSDGSAATGVIDPGFVVAGFKATDKSVVAWSADGTEWESPNVLEMASPSESFYGVDCDDSGNCVAVGKNGAVVYSSNGTSWSEATSNVDHYLRGVAYGEGRWVAVGIAATGGGVAIYSDDSGVTWSEAALTGANGFYDVAYGNGMWFACSPSAQQYWSDDGETWTQIDLQNSITDQPGDWLFDIAYGNGVWVGVGFIGLVIYSTTPTDDSSWYRGTYSSGENSLVAIDYGNGRFIAVGDGNYDDSALMIVSSDNGATWAVVDLPSDYTSLSHPISDIAYGDGNWSTVGNYGDYLLSTDEGDSWSTVATDWYSAWAISYRP